VGVVGVAAPLVLQELLAQVALQELRVLVAHLVLLALVALLVALELQARRVALAPPALLALRERQDLLVKTETLAELLLLINLLMGQIRMQIPELEYLGLIARRIQVVSAKCILMIRIPMVMIYKVILEQSTTLLRV
jgi:hypothetical protein